MHRGRYKVYWYASVRDMIGNMNKLEKEDSRQAEIYRQAIEEATQETLQLKDGEARMEAVKMVYINKTHNARGAGAVLHYSENTIKKWISNFVISVGKKAGF